jgi:class 3 adenylate cyclase
VLAPPLAETAAMSAESLPTRPLPRATPAPVHLPDAAFLFADIAGFTAFTERHGDLRAAELAWRLRLGVEEQLDHDAHVVKTIGDAVMARIGDPAAAADAGRRIVSSALPQADDPPLRVGIHWGPAVECAGDYFGAAVNVAARVAALAEPGEVLVTGELASAATGHSLELVDRGTRALHNVARPTRIHAVVEHAGAPDLSDDAPVRRRRARSGPWLRPVAAPAFAFGRVRGAQL